MFACGDREAGRQPLYNGSGPLRLCLPLLRLAAAAAMLGAVAAAGCSFPLETMFDKSEADTEQTGSTVLGYRAPQGAETVTPSEVDLAYARAAAAEALTRGGKDSSVPWENPHTGAGGNITPLAVSYSQGAFICRDFLASYVRGQSQAWLQGEACRTEHGKWEVRSMRPFRS